MIKVKDDVDLKILSRYGFKLNKERDAYVNYKDGNWWEQRVVDVETRELQYFVEEIGYWTFVEDEELLKSYFEDLVVTDLVEMVDNDESR